MGLKHQIITILSGFMLIMGLSSCQECIECQYHFTDPENNQKDTFTFEEFCGTSKDVDEFKQNAKADAREVDGDLQCKQDTEWFF